ncbi:hypothetical protein [Peribacillus alkalitolerans]|uniref:hypothetical protein n=1 Tax=Peribacillus alkalitolerans TaxID=1550385 RepID=UPI0013D46B1C|nr:hypothetical protein [Peribacillus alkalitolerans]
MVAFANYRDFFQRCIIPIGFEDSKKLVDLTTDELFATHWLVALEGGPESIDSEYYLWKVVVYPSNQSGKFEYAKPYYTSAYHHKFDAAVDLAKSIERTALTDTLIQSYFHQKIS